METDVLRELGFTEREIKVYLAMLELGSTTVGPISAKSGLPYTKVYETLERLIAKGLVSYTVVSKTKHYEADDPKEILNLIEDRKRRFTSILDELQQKRKYSEEKQIVVVHEGYKAFKAMFNRIFDELKRGDYYYAFNFKEEYLDTSAPIFLRNFHQKLAQKKIDDRAIGSLAVKGSIMHTFEGIKNIKQKFVKRTTPTGVVIIKDKVIQLMWGERPTAIEITSPQIHQRYKAFFEEMWAEGRSP